MLPQLRCSTAQTPPGRKEGGFYRRQANMIIFRSLRSKSNMDK